jgi:hypothetical protein
VPPQLKAMLNSQLLSINEKEETTSPQFTTNKTHAEQLMQAVLKEAFQQSDVA